jgi:hypothetical protein
MDSYGVGRDMRGITVKPDVLKYELDRDLDHQLGRLQRRISAADSINLESKSEEYRSLKNLVVKIRDGVASSTLKGNIGRFDPAYALLLHGLMIDFDRVTNEYWSKKIELLDKTFSDYIRVSWGHGKEVRSVLSLLLSNIPPSFSHLARDPKLVSEIDSLLDEWQKKGEELEPLVKEVREKKHDENELLLRKKQIVDDMYSRITAKVGDPKTLFYRYGVERGLQILPKKFSKSLRRELHEKLKTILPGFIGMAHALADTPDDQAQFVNLKEVTERAIDKLNAIESDPVKSKRKMLELDEIPKEELAFLIAVGHLKDTSIFGSQKMKLEPES